MTPDPATAETPRILLREGRASDHPFVFASWIKSFRFSAFAKHIPHDDYCRGQHDVVEELLARARLVVAALPEDEDAILGYAVLEPDVLHYVFVKERFQRFGIGAQLVRELPETVVCTHRTYVADDILFRWGRDNALAKGRCPRCERALRPVERGGVTLYQCPDAKCPWVHEHSTGGEVRRHRVVTYDPFRAWRAP